MDKAATGWINGLIGVVIFSGSLPATRVAVTGFDPLFVTAARAAIAGFLAAILLVAAGGERPNRSDLGSLFVAAFGVVIGFPLLTALALRDMSSAHAIVFLPLLPLVTSVFGVWRGGERPRPAFWFFSLLGSAIMIGYAFRTRIPASFRGDSLMLAAIFICGLGYAEGARLSRRLGGWKVISWALVLSIPLTFPLALARIPSTWSGISWPPIIGLAYVSLFSMLIGFFFWYRGLAQGGITAVSQLQLLQPFFGFLWSALLLGERVNNRMLLVAVLTVACVIGARRFAQPGALAAAAESLAVVVQSKTGE